MKAGRQAIGAAGGGEESSAMRASGRSVRAACDGNGNGNGSGSGSGASRTRQLETRAADSSLRSSVVTAVLAVAAASFCNIGQAAAPAQPTANGVIYPGARAPTASIEQQLGAELPLAAAFVNADGRAVRLGDFFASGASRPAVPVVVVLGYYRCPQLCETVMQGALEALARSGARRDAYRVVAVSIDASETPADARMRLAVDRRFADFAARGAGHDADAALPLDLHELVGGADAIGQLAHRAGFVFSRLDDDRAGPAADTSDPATSATAVSRFAHASGFLVATPQGRISRYFLGVRHDPEALRSALDAAAGESIGSLVDRLVLLCAHFDPSLGRFSQPVLSALRLLGAGLVLGLAAWIWRHRRPAGHEGTT